jgi:hypothetical protein
MAIRTHLNGSLCLLAPLAALLAAAPSSAAAQAIPSPESVLGHTVGEDFFLATFEESLDYFEQLAAASDRVELLEVGRTSLAARPTSRSSRHRRTLATSSGTVRSLSAWRTRRAFQTKRPGSWPGKGRPLSISMGDSTPPKLLTPSIRCSWRMISPRRTTTPKRSPLWKTSS